MNDRSAIHICSFYHAIALLFLPRTLGGRDPIHLRELQPLASILDWEQQRTLWQALLGRTAAKRVKEDFHRRPFWSKSTTKHL
jgi:hypothetical protein